MKRIVPVLTAVLLVACLARAASAEMCEKCARKPNPESIHTCAKCGDMTAVGHAKICPKCSEKLGECEMCRRKLVAADKPDKPKGFAPNVARAGDHIQGVHRDKALQAKAPERGVIADANTLRELLTAWGHKDADWTTDFSNNIVLVATADGPNRVRVTAKLIDGDLKVLGMATRMAGPGFGWAMLVHSRQGVKTVDGKPLPAPPKPAAEPVRLTEEDNGKTVEMTVGQELILRLKGNATTGFAWTVAKLDGDALKQAGKVEYEQENTGRMGSGGVYVATFEAVKQGEAVLGMHYARPWEKDEKPARTFRLTVKVKPAEAGEVRIVNQWQGAHGGGESVDGAVIRDQEAFHAAWKARRGRGLPPRVDFSKHMVLLVDMGRKNSGGYSVKITSVEMDRGKVVATVEHTSPGPDDMVTMALTSPWCMAEIDVAGKEVVFKPAGRGGPVLRPIRPRDAVRPKGGVEGHIPGNLPDARSDIKPRKTPVSVDILTGGEYRMGSKTHTPAGLLEALKEVKASGAEAVVLKAEPKAKWSHVVQAYRICVESGFEKVSFATD